MDYLVVARFLSCRDLPRHIEMLLSAMIQMNEPNSLYGIIQSHQLTSQIITFEHEGNWSKAPEYYHLQIRYDPVAQGSSCTLENFLHSSRFAVDQMIEKKPYKGFLRSLQQIGRTHLLGVYCQGLTSQKGRFQHDPEFAMLQYEAIWLSGNWDFSLLYGESSVLSIQHGGDHFNESLRSCLRALKEGDSIPVSARNLDGMLIVKEKKTWKNSMLSKIVQLTEEAQLSKPKLQRWLDKFGEKYSKAVVLLSLAVAFLGPFLFKWPFISTAACRGSVYRALGLMVTASPCALAVAPLAYATAISTYAKRGILLKGGEVLDALASCHSIAFDKTGALTTGEFMCKVIELIHGHGKRIASCCVPSCEKETFVVAAAMERGTTHPIGKAVVDHSTGCMEIWLLFIN